MGSTLALYLRPELREDMLHINDKFSLIVVQISFGYFIYDLLDMLRMNGWNPLKLKEMVLHHACCITCATIAVYTGTYSGYAMVGLSMEVNSIFLHAR